MGTRHMEMKKSFKFCIRSLLTPCSKQEFRQAFPNFTNAAQERLHRMFIQDEFESVCLETQAEEQNQHLRDRVELLKKERLDVLGIENAVERLRSGSVMYGMYNSNGLHNP
ncbi:hypothetical protein ACE6H2_016117 [Prunus campanulata]